MTRKEAYDNGFIFVRKRHLGTLYTSRKITEEWAIYVSRQYRKWQLLGRFHSESECDEEIKILVNMSDKFIIE